MIRGKVSSAQELGTCIVQEDRCLYIPVRSKVSTLEGYLLAIMDGYSHHYNGYLVSELCQEYIPRLFSINYADQARQSLYNLTQQLVRITTNNVYQGSTLSLALVLESHHKVDIATIGDSLVLVIENERRYIAPLHNVNVNRIEREAAQKRGGVYQGRYIYIKQSDSFDNKPYGLQVSRSLGGLCMKEVIYREPEIITKRLPENAAVCMLTDGMCDAKKWSFLSDVAEISDYVRSGANASQLMEKKETQANLSDNASILLWSTF